MGGPPLVDLLIRHLAAGSVATEQLLPAISALLPDEPISLSKADLFESLQGQEGEAFERLRHELEHDLVKTALELNELARRRQPIPKDLWQELEGFPSKVSLSWRSQADGLAALQGAVSLLQDRSFLIPRRGLAPRLAETIDRALREAAAEVARQPVPWRFFPPEGLIDRLESEIGQTEVGLREALARLRSWLQSREQQAKEAAEVVLERWSDGAVGESEIGAASEVDEDAIVELLEERFRSATTRQRQEQLLDFALLRPTDRVRPILVRICEQPWALLRAAVVLALRFGEPGLTNCESWRRWLLKAESCLDDHVKAVADHLGACPGELLYTWCSTQKRCPPESLFELEQWCKQRAGDAVEPTSLVERWTDQVPQRERELLLADAAGPPPVADTLGKPAEAAEAPVVPPEKPAAPAESFVEPPEKPAAPAESFVEPPEEAAAAAAPRGEEVAPREDREPAAPTPRKRPVAAQVPAGPSIWGDQVQPFLLDNWYIVVGIIMVVVGSSLVAYYTWDQHWLIRYTILPLLLAGFTMALARTGTWLEGRDQQLQGTAAILRGAAIGLLPINFMTVSLVAEDPQIANPGPVVVLVAAAYLALFGWALRRWCAAVHPGLGAVLGGSLLALNGLAILRPVSQTLFGFGDEATRLMIGVGFHIGFAVLAAAVVFFSRNVLSPELASERRVVWFFGATLFVTFLQVFAWVHGSMGYVPRVATYAPMVILAGGLVLLIERHALGLTEDSTEHGAESFLGFALIMLGLLMGQADPYVRILCLFLAGVVWLYQAQPRRHPLHDWAGLTLIMLGVVAIGMLDFYPAPQRPTLGILLALGVGAFGSLSARRGWQRLREASRGLQVVALFLTTVVAVLSQWHYRSEPLITAAYLLIAAAMFSWRARDEERLDWLHTAMVIFALALPYLGFVDVEARSLQGNTMVFGLALLSFGWLTLIWTRPREMLLRARSTVLWTYGALAVAAMAIGVMVEGIAPTDASAYQVLMDLSGPHLMAATLCFAAYYSRSLIPAVVAAVIVIVFFPELQTQWPQLFFPLEWGSGLGSAISALGLILLCFPLRTRLFPSGLSDGDLFLGRVEFPLLRRDHTLFTWPLLASAVYLTVKTETWILLDNLFAALGLRTPIALVLAGLCWTLLGVYHRAHAGAVAGTHLGWISLLAGLTAGHWVVAEAFYWQWPVLATGLVLQGLFVAYRFLLAPRYPWADELLAAPTRQVLDFGSLTIAVACALWLWSGDTLAHNGLLVLFVAAQLCWHGIAGRHALYGSFLFVLAWIALLVGTAPGAGALPGRVSVAASLTPSLWFLLAIQAVQVLTEARKSSYELLRPLLVPLQVGAVSGAVGLAVVGAGHSLVQGWLSPAQLALICALLLLSARANRSGPLALMAMLIAYLLVCSGSLYALPDFVARLEFLASPWRWSLMALAMAAAGAGGKLLFGYRSWLLAGPYPLSVFRQPVFAWIYPTAAAFTVLAASRHTLDPGLRSAAVQLWAPYIGALALVLIAWSWRRGVFLYLAAALVTAGNVHASRFFLGDLLRANGLSEIHLICIGLAASIVLAFIVRALVKTRPFNVGINQASMVLGSLVLVLLGGNYLVHPDLERVTSVRFMVSAVMAYLAALAFRQVARDLEGRESGEVQLVEFCERAHHVGTTLAIWCAALLLPPLRRPIAALFALSLPAFYFAARAEVAWRAGLERAARFRNAATILGFALLALYVFRGAFQMVLFPDVPVGTDYYHGNAPLMMALGVMLLRMHGLGGAWWLAFYGGLSIMTGSYFTLTWLPGLSPFDQGMAAAWCAVLLGHFWTIASNQRSPLSSGVRLLAAIDEDTWLSLRRGWGICLLVATQVAVAWGILDVTSIGYSTYGIAPLLLGAASVLVYHGILRSSPWYLLAAAFEVVAALHADFVVPSYLQREHVLWALLGIWAATVVADALWGSRLAFQKAGLTATAFATLSLVQVIYHHPSSVAGLSGVVLIGVLALLTSRPRRTAATNEERLAAGLPLLLPPWLVYFSQAQLMERGPTAALEAWPLIATVATVLLTGYLASLYRGKPVADSAAPGLHRARLYHQTLDLIDNVGTVIYTFGLWTTLVVVTVIQAFHYQEPFAEREIVLVCGLYVALAVGWFNQARQQHAMLPQVLAEISVLALFVAVRRHLTLTTDFWSHEYDVWATLTASVVLAGAQQITDLQRREVRVPATITLLLLPVVALGWTLGHGLGADMALLVVGLHSLIFAFLGKDERESPYNIAAVLSFVAFVLITFWNKLELRVIHAYVVPVGLGILVLLQLLGPRISQAARNLVRLVTLLTMLGSVGYYALVDERYPVVFNLTMVLLCLFCMALGSFLRIRLYLFLGFTGVLVNLASIVYKALVVMDRGARMSSIGMLVLAIGIGLVAGAIHFKTHRQEYDARMELWRSRLAAWE